MRYFVLLLFTGSSVLGQRYPGLFRGKLLYFDLSSYCSHKRLS